MIASVHLLWYTTAHGGGLTTLGAIIAGWFGMMLLFSLGSKK